MERCHGVRKCEGFLGTRGSRFIKAAETVEDSVKRTAETFGCLEVTFHSVPTRLLRRGGGSVYDRSAL